MGDVVHEERFVGYLTREITRERESAERGAVVTLLPRYEVPALRFSLFEEILPRELHGRVHGFAAATYEVGFF